MLWHVLATPCELQGTLGQPLLVSPYVEAAWRTSHLCHQGQTSPKARDQSKRYLVLSKLRRGLGLGLLLFGLLAFLVPGLVRECE